MGEPGALTQEDGEKELGAAGLPAVESAGQEPAVWARVALDLFERAFVLMMFCALAWSVVQAAGHGATWVNPLTLATEGLNVVFILIRKRAQELSYRPVDWVVAFAAVTFSLAVRPGNLPPLVPPVAAAAVILTGFGIQIWSKLTLRRAFGITPANRGLTVRGPYKLVRHPMYVGYLIGWIGFYLVNPTIWNTNIYAMCLLLQWLRIEAEERVLAKDPAFEAFRAQTPYKVIPGLY